MMAMMAKYRTPCDKVETAISASVVKYEEGKNKELAEMIFKSYKKHLQTLNIKSEEVKKLYLDSLKSRKEVYFYRDKVNLISDAYNLINNYKEKDSSLDSSVSNSK